jgi:hypothetical protein
MSIKFGSIIFVILTLFVAKLSIENFNQAQAEDKVVMINSESIN